MKFDETVSGKDRINWLKAVKEEFLRFEKNRCFEPVERKDIDPTCTVMASTWAIKKKASGNFCDRLNERGFEQIEREREHYEPEHVSSPVTNKATMRIVLLLMIMTEWASY